MSRKISNYFNERECTVSDSAERAGMKNEVPKELMETIEYTAARMDTVRVLLGVPCIVKSWYRSPEVNKLVKGSATSDHMNGIAIDFNPKMNLEEAYKKIIDSGLGYDQLIIYPKDNFIHISFKRDMYKERKMNLRK